MEKINWKRNLYKALMMMFSIGVLSLVTYGVDYAVLLGNLIVTTILAFFANSVVDLFFYYIEQKKELAKLTKEK